MTQVWEVKLIRNGGIEIVIHLPAASQSDAKRLAEHQYPGYRYRASKPIRA
jgi:hypothetical protein